MHCPGCCGKVPSNTLAHVGSSCPGVTCPQCADMWEALNAKDAEIARLTKVQCEEPIEHGAIDAIREVLALTDDNNGFIDDDVARVVSERNRLRALVAVGQLIVDANEVWPGKTVHTEEWRRLEQKWRSLERKG